MGDRVRVRVRVSLHVGPLHLERAARSVGQRDPVDLVRDGVKVEL